MSDDRKMSIWGVGPSILLSAAVYGAAAGLATYLRPDLFLITPALYLVFLVFGLFLLVAGVIMLMFAGRAIVGAHGEDKLATTGVFGLVRHPIYSAWIVFLIPGLVLLSRSWLLLLTPLVAYLVLKSRIRTEDEYLEKRFGQAYQNYRQSVNEIIPMPRHRRRIVKVVVGVCLFVGIWIALFVYHTTDIANSSTQLHLRLLGSSVYECHAKTGQWPTRIDDLSQTSAARAPHWKWQLENEVVVIVWSQDLKSDPKENADVILAYHNKGLLAELGRKWVCWGDLRTEYIRTKDLRTKLAR
jgi:protein-S-isoprenylcysteine O-methyltransferase Ste14